MPEITINLPTPLNASVQEGDVAYYVPINSTDVGGFQVTTNQEPIEIGIILSITITDAKFRFVNDSKQKAEMFATACDVAENSK